MKMLKQSFYKTESILIHIQNKTKGETQRNNKTKMIDENISIFTPISGVIGGSLIGKIIMIHQEGPPSFALFFLFQIYSKFEFVALT